MKMAKAMVCSAGAMADASAADGSLVHGGSNFDVGGGIENSSLGNQRWRELFPLPRASLGQVAPFLHGVGVPKSGIRYWKLIQ